MLESNNNDKSQRLAIECDALFPDLENKERVWNIITYPIENKISTYDYSAYISGFFGKSQVDLLQPYISKYLDELVRFADYPEKEYMSLFEMLRC